MNLAYFFSRFICATRQIPPKTDLFLPVFMPHPRVFCACVVGLSVEFASNLFQAWLRERDMSSISSSLKKSGLETSLMVCSYPFPSFLSPPPPPPRLRCLPYISMPSRPQACAPPFSKKLPFCAYRLPPLPAVFLHLTLFPSIRGFSFAVHAIPFPPYPTAQVYIIL